MKNLALSNISPALDSNALLSSNSYYNPITLYTVCACAMFLPYYIQDSERLSQVNRTAHRPENIIHKHVDVKPYLTKNTKKCSEVGSTITEDACQKLSLILYLKR